MTQYISTRYFDNSYQVNNKPLYVCI